MSGTRVTTTRPPLIAPSRSPSSRTPITTAIAELLALALHQRGRDDARQRHHRADRQVDPARDDDDGLGDGRERQRQHRRREALERDRAVAGLDRLREQQEPDEDRRAGRSSTRSVARHRARISARLGADVIDGRRRPRSRRVLRLVAVGGVGGGCRIAAAGRAGSPAAASPCGDDLGGRDLRQRESALRLYAARSRAGSSASAPAISRTTRPPKIDDRPIADELDLLELRGVEEDGRAGLGEVAQQQVDLAASCGCRSRASGRSTASCGRRRRPSARSSTFCWLPPDSRRTSPPARASIWRRLDRARRPSPLLAQVDQAPARARARGTAGAMFSRTERCMSRASARSAAT